ncbi:uncharacterized protein Tco025E_03473 [Trypanosoma conorhini]|uniref:Transmembrane protein n=1 Tax=Trypanosoma conorhini TaxID=83891 RepID=A0A3R7S4X1_9TRYP|nr:uncharacterized protein Tco025E_03473 [Trypanosoma conorhini]RNF21423.1 hypothetical protein Tco025E_03473 [Trypanosoma conorhini]
MGRPRHNRNDASSWETFITCCLSHLALLPSIRYLQKRGMHYEVCVSTFAAVVSFLYHATESLRMPFFLSTMRWHRLDNIGAIASITIVCLHLCCFESEKLLEYLKYAFLFLTIVLQEADPWNVVYTAGPILFASLLVLTSHLLYPARRRRIAGRNLNMSMVSFLLAVICFVFGLEDKKDTYRMWHGLFHVFVGVGIYNVFQALGHQGKSNRKMSWPALSFEV